MKRFLLLAIPFLLATQAYPAASAWLYRWQEPHHQIPLELERPIKVRQDSYGSGLYGAKRSGGRKHRGLDLRAPVGTPVLAVKSGRAEIGRLKNGLGHYLEIKHPNGWMSRYAHLKKILVSDGQKIKQGEVIGLVGKSGNARRKAIQSHLHLELWNEEESPIDPLPHLLQSDAS